MCWWWSASEEGQTQGEASLKHLTLNVPRCVPLQDVPGKENALKVELMGPGDLLDESLRDREVRVAPSVLAWHPGGQRRHSREAAWDSQRAWWAHVFRRGWAEFGALEAYTGQWAHTH